MNSTNKWSNWGVFDTSVKHRICKAGKNSDGRLELAFIDINGWVFHIGQKPDYNQYYKMENFEFKGEAKDLTISNNQDGRIEIFALGGDGTVHNIWQTTASGSWSGWGHDLVTEKGFTAIRSINGINGRIEIFAIDHNGSIKRSWQTNKTWSAWEDLKFGGGAKDFAIGKSQDGRIEVFALGSDGSVHHAWQTSLGGSWTSWDSGFASENGCTAIDVALNKDGRLEVFVLNSSGDMKSKYQIGPNQSWGNWVTYDIKGFGNNLEVVANKDGRLEAFMLDKDHRLLHAYQASPNTGPWIKESLGTPEDRIQIDTFSVVANNEKDLEVFGVNINRAAMKIVEVKRYFRAWASKVAPVPPISSLEHTWVEAINPTDKFACFGSTEKRHLLLELEAEVDSNARNRADYCRESNSKVGKDGAGINRYAIQGFCHQAANRFLMLVGKRLNDGVQPGGYTATCGLCGVYGTTDNFNEWYNSKVLPAYKKYPVINGDEMYSPFPSGSLNDRILQLYLNAEKNNMDNNEVIIKSTSLMLADKIEGYQDEPFASKHREILRKRDELLSRTGLLEGSEAIPKMAKEEVVSVFGELNKLGQELQTALKEILGANSYGLLTNDGDDILYDVVDIESALEIYAEQ